jgi:hypothetical protein
MADDPVRKYQAALRKLKDAEKKAKHIASIVQSAGEAMRYWEDACVTGTASSYPGSMKTGDIGHKISATTWPTANEIDDALISYHVSKEELKRAWEAVPKDDRIGLSDPDLPK